MIFGFFGWEALSAEEVSQMYLGDVGVSGIPNWYAGGRKQGLAPPHQEEVFAGVRICNRCAPGSRPK